MAEKPAWCNGYEPDVVKDQEVHGERQVLLHVDLGWIIFIELPCEDSTLGFLFTLPYFFSLIHAVLTGQKYKLLFIVFPLHALLE
ncbi:hypothetical protein D3C85_1301710 [compost metagenome]